MINTFHGEHFFLSNFYPVLVFYEGVLWPSSEHAYQAAKTLDYAMKFKIFNATSPCIAKRFGRKLKSIRPDWEDVKLQIMEDIVRIKFYNPVLGKALVDTADEELVEGNTWKDLFWGVCNGEGENHLGKILMKIRLELQQNAQS